MHAGQTGGDVGLDLHDLAVQTSHGYREGSAERHQPTPCKWVISGTRLRPMRTPITSMRTAAQLRCCAASHSPASRRNRRTLLGVTAWDTPPNWSLVRVFTSTNTTMRAASSAAITSSSPYPHRQLRVNTRSPRDLRWSTASCSPSAPISARFNVVMTPPCESAPTIQRPERAVFPNHELIHIRLGTWFRRRQKTSIRTPPC